MSTAFRNLITQPVFNKLSSYCDEGFYFVANNAQTAEAMTAASAFSATAPYLVIENGNPAPTGEGAGPSKNIVVDYIRLLATAAGGATSGLSYVAFALYLDSTLRYSSGGTALTAYNSNMNSQNASAATIYAGAVTASAASANVRPLVGQASMRPAVSASVACVVGDQFLLDFGSIEGGMAGSITVSNAEMISIPVPPVLIGPQQSALLYLWLVGATGAAAASFVPEIGYLER